MAVIENFRVFEHAAEHRVRIGTVRGERLMRTDRKVSGVVELVGDGVTDGTAALACFDD